MQIKSLFGNYNVHLQKFNFNKINNEDVYIIDKNVHDLFFKKFNIKKKIIIISNETAKSFEKISNIFKNFLYYKVNRKTKINVIGGGVVQDISSFSCSIYLRGLKWNFYPTTLLAQADSCIGSKTSINLNKTKNLIGNFYPPSKIIIDKKFLETLHINEIHSGIGEIIKCLILEKFFFKNTKLTITDKIFEKKNLNFYISEALKIKKKFIEKDEFDRNIRNLLNYGHSFGHAIEAASKFKIPHGIAVSMGMDLANFFSFKYDYLSRSNFEKLTKILKKNYNKFKKFKINKGVFLDVLKKDKKNLNQNKVMLILVKNKTIKKIEIKVDKKFKSVIQIFFNSYLLD